jgi:serine protease
MRVHSRPRRWRVLLPVALVLVAIGAVTRSQRLDAQAGERDKALRRAQAFAVAAANRLDYLPGEVLVRFKAGAPAERQRALSSLRSRPSLNDLTWSGDIAVLRDPLEPDSRKLAQALSEQPEVAWAEPNYIQKLPVMREIKSLPLAAGAPRPSVTPNDPDFTPLQWNFSRNVLDMERTWDIQNGGTSDVIVAVVDTGFTTADQTVTFPIFDGFAIRNFAVPFAVSPDLNQSRIVNPRDFTFFNQIGPMADMDGHGTHVASTIGEQTNNGIGLAGMAFNVRIMPVKVCTAFWELQIARSVSGLPGLVPFDSGGCATSDIVNGIRFAADNGAKVINLSIGGLSQSLAERDAIQTAVNRGAVVTIAMGNEFEDGNPTEFPAAFASSIDGALSVAAVGRTLQRAFYSSTGAHCEIAAPGGDSRQGGTAGEIFQTTVRQSDVSPLLIAPRFDRFNEVPFQGTSMAAPHVAGLAALIISQSPSMPPAAVEQLIKQTARDLGQTGRDNDFGFGLIQPRKALFGFGIR